MVLKPMFLCNLLNQDTPLWIFGPSKATAVTFCCLLLELVSVCAIILFVRDKPKTGGK